METIEVFFQTYTVPFTIIHVLSVVVGMGGALMSDLLFNFYTRDKALSKTELGTLSLLSKTVLIAFPVIILSGGAIFMSNIDKFIHSAKFLVKMTVVVILLLNGLILDKYIWSHLLKKKFFTAPSEKKFRRLSFACGAISVLSWIFVCVLGVLDSLAISYRALLGVYIALCACAIPIALFIEKHEFEKKNRRR